MDGYLDLLQVLATEGLAENVAPIQLGIRLLIPEGSRILELEDIHKLIESFDAQSLVYPWENTDPRLDKLSEVVQQIASSADQKKESRTVAFEHIWQAAHAIAGQATPPIPFRKDSLGKAVPFLSEPWYCCAEPTKDQLISIGTVAKKAVEPISPSAGSFV